MSERVLQIGDVVRLKSNDYTEMTVEKISVTNETAFVVWFDMNNHLQRDSVKLTSLIFIR